MSSEPTQSFANHSRTVTGFHFVTFGLLVVYLIWTAWHAMTTRSLDAHFQILGAMGMLGTAWYARAFPVQAQNRIIRLEEQLRLAKVLPDDLRARIDELSPRQLIALRFASDAELPELVRWVLTERVIDNKAIKQRIKDWRPDFYRV